MKNNKIKGILWLVLPVAILFVWFIIFGLVTVITSATGTPHSFLASIFPIITALLIILMFIGFGLGIYFLVKKSDHENTHEQVLLNKKYAGFWKRFAARIIDSIIVGISALILLAILSAIFGDDATILLYPIMFIGNWLYYALFESSHKQATIGKMALKIIATDTEGGKLSFGQASGRHFAKIISVITFYIGFLITAFTEKKQALHDIIADTLIVNKKQ